MAAGSVTFASGGQALAKAFTRTHIRQTSPGAFFVFQLGTSASGTIVYGLVKYDYRSVLELVAADGQQALRQIVQAFVTDKRAIQKSCLVRVVNGVAEATVSAVDRTRVAPDLTDYFLAFLEVARARSDEDLSRDLDDALRKTIQDLKEILPNRDIPAALEIAKQSLRGRTMIDDGAVRDAVTLACGQPRDPKVLQELEKTISRQFKRKRLVGVEFQPVAAVLKQRPRRRIRTAENVVVQYPGEQEGQTVKVEQSGPGWVITIRTSKDLADDAVLPPERS
jgi:hypothetical protein